MLIAIPDTIWSARNWMETTAWINAIRPPATIATSVASHGLCQARSATTEKKAPVSIMPSMAMFTTPLRSEMTPPSAGRRRRTAAASAACHRLAVRRRWPTSPRALTCLSCGLGGWDGGLGHEACRGRKFAGLGGRHSAAEGQTAPDGAHEVGRNAEQDQRLQHEH